MDLPRDHRWSIECAEPGLTVDEQIARVIARINPQSEKIADLVSDLMSEWIPWRSCFSKWFGTSMRLTTRTRIIEKRCPMPLGSNQKSFRATTNSCRLAPQSGRIEILVGCSGRFGR